MPLDYDAILKRLDDTLTVIVGIQERQACVQKLQAEELDAVRERAAEHDRSMADHKARMDHIDMRLAEMTDKLSGLIDIVDGWIRKPKQE